MKNETYNTFAVKTLFLLLLMNPVFSLVFDSTRIYYHYIYLPLVTLMILIAVKKLKTCFNISLIICIIIALCEVNAVIRGNSLGKQYNHLFNYIDACLLMIYISDCGNLVEFKELVKENIKLFKYIVIIINIVEAVLLITGLGYSYNTSWKGTFFKGSNSMAHTLSYLMIVTIIYVFICVTYTKNKKFSVMAIIPCYCIFKSGARVTLILMGIIVFLFLFYLLSKNNEDFLTSIFRIILICTGFLVIFWRKILYSDVVTKIIYRMSNGNITAGRTYIVRDLLNKFVTKGDIMSFFIGQGDAKTYFYNLQNPLVKAEIWGHNDLIQILIGKGILGIAIYVYSLGKYFIALIRTNGNIYTYGFIGMIIIMVVLNGFYSYKDIMLCIPFIMVLNAKLSY